MRGQLTKLRDPGPPAILAGLVLLCVGLAVTAWSRMLTQEGIPQQSNTPRGVTGTIPGSVPGAMPGAEEPNPDIEQMERRQAVARNVDRQKQLVKDTDKLFALATELKDEVAKTNKDTLSVDVIKKADEIEKLARSVREKMKAQ
jgi:xanthosine utilization system XapX-like protein